MIQKTEEKIGLATTLIFLSVSYFRSEYEPFLSLGIIALLITIIHPKIWAFFIPLWNTVLLLLEATVSKLLLLSVFFLVILPMGIIRRSFGIDAMKTAVWRNGNTSVFTDRKHVFSADDLKKPY